MWNVKNQYRFFFPWEREEELEILTDSHIYHQLTRVLRIQKGACIIVLDGEGTQILLQIEDIHKSALYCKIIDKQVQAKEDNNFHLILGAPKKEALKDILKYGTQLGAISFHLIPTDYSQVSIKDYEHKRHTWQAILKESLEQSERAHMPKLFTHDSWESLKKEQNLLKEQVFVADVPNKSKKLWKSLWDYSFKDQKDFYFLIGPEGGWSEKEIEIFTEWPGNFYSLTPYILRLETAAFSSLVVAQTILDAQKKVLESGSHV